MRPPTHTHLPLLCRLVIHHHPPWLPNLPLCLPALPPNPQVIRENPETLTLGEERHLRPVASYLRAWLAALRPGTGWYAEDHHPGDDDDEETGAKQAEAQPRTSFSSSGSNSSSREAASSSGGGGGSGGSPVGHAAVADVTAGTLLAANPLLLSWGINEVDGLLYFLSELLQVRALLTPTHQA